MTRFLRFVAAAFAGALLLAACSNGSSTTPTSSSVVHFAKVIPQTWITVNGKKVVVPREQYSPGRPIQAAEDQGGHVIISTDGVLPRLLVGPTPVVVAFTNLTNNPVTVHNLTDGWTSPTIAPGKTWNWNFAKPLQVNFGYVTSNGFRGSVAMGQLPFPPLPVTTTTSPK